VRPVLRAALCGLLLLVPGCSAGGPVAGAAPVAGDGGASRSTPATTAPPAGGAPSGTVPAEPTGRLPATTGPVPAVAVEAPVVVLDPGHNGGNAAAPGAIGRPVPDGRGGTKACNTVGTTTDAGYPEHAFNWDVAGRVEERLTRRGIRVVLTRPDDTGIGPCVDERGTAGERAGADAVVSIHADGAAPAGRGFHVAYSEPPVHPVQAGPARELATAMRDALRDNGFPVSTYAGRDGLSPRPDLAGLNRARRVRQHAQPRGGRAGLLGRRP
jgi:N-acetylmuramoyl-L-alanine amidase